MKPIPIELNPDGTFPYLQLEVKTSTSATTTYIECKHINWVSERITIKRFGLEICKELVVFCYDCKEFINGKAAEKVLRKY